MAFRAKWRVAIDDLAPQQQTVPQAPIQIDTFVTSFLNAHGHKYDSALAAASGAESAAIIAAARIDRGFGQADRVKVGIEAALQFNRRQLLAPALAGAGTE